MHVFFSIRRIALVVALAMPCLAVPVASAQADDFRVRGTFVNTSVQGNHIEGSLSGQAKPGGKLVGTFSVETLSTGEDRGMATLDFGGGDTLTYHFEDAFDAETGLLVGTYVITRGTGSLAGASGGGLFIVDPAAGEFRLEGTLTF